MVESVLLRCRDGTRSGVVLNGCGRERGANPYPNGRIGMFAYDAS